MIPLFRETAADEVVQNLLTLSDSGFGVGPEGQGPSEGQGQAALLRAGVDQRG